MSDQERGPRTSLAGLRVVVVDDEPDVLLGLERLVRTLGCDVATARSGEEALAALEAKPADVVLTDVRMPGMSGADLLKAILARWPRTATILLTGFGTIELAVSCLRAGAAHFLSKPFDNAEILTTIERLGRQILAERQARPESSGVEFVATDPKMRAVVDLIEQVAPSPLPVLIEGASGTGKELVARLIHARSHVRERPFLAINTAALPDSLLESELFGHRRGAFTGADRPHEGIFQQAAGGTVFLDEIASMSLAFQAKLLRVLQEKVVRPLGTAKDEPVDFRLVAAANRDLAQLVAQGNFREDLYYRLRVVSIALPPLRERVADIPALAAHFLRKASRACFGEGQPLPQLTPAALDALCSAPWPGNIRQLENTIQRAVVVCQGTRIMPHHLALGETAPGETPPRPEIVEARSYEDEKKATLERFQRQFIARALERTHGNVSRASESCGLTRAAFQKIMRSLAIDRAEFESSPGENATSD